MAETDETEVQVTKKTSRMPLILGLLVALAGGGAGFFAVYTGLILGHESGTAAHDEHPMPAALPDISNVDFVPIDPLVISLGDTAGSTHLRFRAQLEVVATHKQEVERLMPRVVDVLNSYLRALEIDDLRGNAALVRLRAQMLRRVQTVIGRDRVNDLLIMEFVMN